MKKSVILPALVALTAVAINTQATVIDFTAAQGYVNGPLHTQDAYHWWCGNPPNTTAWQVDTSGLGQATVSSAEGDWKKITYDIGSALTDGYKGSFDFTLTVSNTVASTATLLIFGTEDSANSYLGLNFELKAESGGGLSMDIYNRVTSSGSGSIGIDPAAIGLPGGTGISATLRMAFTTTTNAGAGTWTTVLTLTNLDTATGVGTATQADWAGSAGATHLTMEEAQLNTITGSDGSIAVDRIAIDPAVVTPPLPPPSTLVDFTAAQGYYNGPLDTQHGYDWWKDGSSTAWQVDTNGTGNATLSSSVGDWQSIAYNLGTPFTNGYAGTFDFSFTLGTPAGSELGVVGCKPQDSANSYKGPNFEFKAAPAGEFAISIWNEVSGGFTKKYFNGAGIGMASGTGTSAKLRMVFTTTPTGAGTWTTVYMLQNLDTGSNTLATLTETGWTGQGWVSQIRMEEAQLNSITGNDGSISVDRLTMGLLTAPPAPTVLSIQNLGNGQFRLEWPNGGTLLETASPASGSWLPIPGAISPYTNSLSGAQKFYRVQVSP